MSNPFSARVIQGQFHGGKPAFAVQARPGFGNHAAQRQVAPHVQAAMQKNAPHFHVAQRKTPTPQPAAPAQPKVRGNATQVPSSLNLSSPGRGQALPPALQQKMETVFGTSFNDVRVHVGPQAQQLGAVAFTLGSTLYFAPGQYNPDSQQGQRLIGHELAHVVQQRSGRVRNPFGRGVAVVQDPGLEAEADRMGLRASQAPMPVQAKKQGQIPTTATRPGDAAQKHPQTAPSGRPMAPHVQAAEAQAKMVQPTGQAQQLSTGGRPRVIQGKFPGGFTELGQRIRQAGVIQPKFSNSSMQLPPALASFQPDGRGRPLPELVQAKMEAVFGTSFSDVRIHEGPAAQQIGAQAFTMGSHIYFAPGQFNPTSAQGQRILGQQLAHVVQQRSRRVQNPFGSGVAVVQDPKLEAEAERMGQRATTYQTPVQTKRERRSLSASIQCMKPHPKDVNRKFLIHRTADAKTPSVGTYKGPGEEGKYKFATSGGTIEVPEAQIIGYRPTVARTHPQNRKRPVEENVHGRDQIFVSEADLSGAMARQRRNPDLVRTMVVTTFENEADSKKLYPAYQQNRLDLESQGVPILENFDISKPETAARLSNMAPNANIHFQMPRVPQGTPKYSTQQLIRDTANMPEQLNRPDVTVSITTPKPSMYKNVSIHNRIYGLESQNALADTKMKIADEGSDSDLEPYGYEHKQTTTNQSTAAARSRKKYKLQHKNPETQPSSQSDEEAKQTG